MLTDKRGVEKNNLQHIAKSWDTVGAHAISQALCARVSAHGLFNQYKEATEQVLWWDTQ